MPVGRSPEAAEFLLHTYILQTAGRTPSLPRTGELKHCFGYNDWRARLKYHRSVLSK